MEYRGLKLDRFQQEAIEAIDADKSVLVSAPTGTGKTLIADYLVADVLAKGGRIIYTAPIKALSNQKYREYTRLHGVDKVGIVTGDVVINHDAPLRIMTTEILRNILLQGVGPMGDETQLGDLQAVIFDELHFIDDPERGTVWEEVLIYLPDTVRVLGLSATLSNLRELAGWLSTVRQGPFGEVAVIEERRRAVPLEFLLASVDTELLGIEDYQKAHKRWIKDRQHDQQRERGDGRSARRHRRQSRSRGRRDERDGTSFTDMINMLDPEDFPALFFLFSRKATENCARIISRRRKGFLNRQEYRDLLTRLDDFDQENDGLIDDTLRDMYTRGVAFHHAGLNVRLKALVEELYEARLVKLLFCTSTFALGINMPARTVLFEALEKFNGEEVAPLTVRQFMQKAGRAGRRGLDDAGQVVVKMDLHEWDAKREHLQRLMSDKPEPVVSTFNLSFHSVVNLLARFSQEEIQGLLSRSFLAYQRATRADSLLEELAQKERKLEHLGQLESAGEGLQRKTEKEVQRLRKRLEREQFWLWDQFQKKVDFLRKSGYIDAKGEFGVGARLLRKLQIEEVFMTELIMAGVFEDLSPEATFGMCAGLVMEMPRRTSVRARLPEELAERLETIFNIYEGGLLHSAVELAGGEPHCDADMMALGYLWARGEALGSLMSRVRCANDISGDLVGAFRRAKDLVGQLRVVFWEDVPRRNALQEIMKAVSRDEVEVIG